MSTSCSTTGKHCINVKTLDAKIATVCEEDPDTERMSRIAHMIYENFRNTGTNETLLEFSGLMSDTLRGEDVEGFHSEW